MAELSVFISIQRTVGQGCFFEELHNYMGNNNEGNENKITLGNFNCTTDKMGKDGGKETERL